MGYEYAVRIGERATVHADNGEGILCGAGKSSIDVDTTSAEVTCKRCLMSMGSNLAAAIAKHESDSNAANTFDETDAATWDEANLPAGYEWREVADGELHLFAPDGRNLSEARYVAWKAPYVAYQEAVWAGASEDTLADMRADIIIPMVTSGELTLIQAESRFWRTLAEVRDNDM